MEGVRLSTTQKESYSTRKKNFKKTQRQHARTKVHDLEETVKHLRSEVLALRSAPTTPSASLALAPVAAPALTLPPHRATPEALGTALQVPDQAMDLGDDKDWECSNAQRKVV